MDTSAEAAPMVLRPTIEVFGKYRLLAEVGHGGMADVFLAISVGPAGFSKLQVIKRLRSSLAEEPELQAMLLDEARLAAQLNHRNIVQTIEVGAVDDKYFIAMELLDGQPFSRIIRRSNAKRTPFPQPLALKMLSEVLAGLHYAHEAKDYDGQPLAVVHRDISPQNVFITYDGQVKVMDFGIAKAARRMVETRTGVVRGKVAYMAPEQALPISGLDGQADVFSVGVMLWETLAGERMWGGMADPEILLKVSTTGAPPLPKRPEIPAELDRICARAVARRRTERYANAAEMRADIDAYLKEQGSPTTPEALGEHVAKLFAEDRTRMQKLVEQQLAAVRASDIADDPTTWSSISRPALVAPASSLASGVPSEPSSAPSDASGVSQAMVKNSPPSDDGSPSRTPRGRAASLSWSRMAGVGLLLAMGALFVMRDRLFGRPVTGVTPPPPTASETLTTVPVVTPTATPTATASVPAPVASEAGHIRLRVSALPPSARITVDGIVLGANPFDGKLVKDVAMHRVVIEAPGYVPQGRMVPFDTDVDLTITLSPRERAPVPTATAASTPTFILEPLKPR
jgi:serine/threonine protein kinase